MKPGTIQLYDEILKLRGQGMVLLTWDEYRDIAVKLGGSISTKEELRSETQFLAMAVSPTLISKYPMWGFTHFYSVIMP